MGGLPLEFGETFGQALRRARKSRSRRQLDLAVDVSVDHSLVSRWESGTVLPTVKDLVAIRVSLQLSDHEYDALSFALARTKEGSDHLPGIVTAPDELIESIRISVDCVRALRKAGQPRMATLLSERDAQSAFDRLRGIRWSAGHGAALIELSELLLEQCKAGLDYLPRAAVRQGALETVLHRQQLIGRACGRGKATFFRDITKEGIAYVGGNIGDAHEISQSLLDSQDQIPSGWLHEVIRATAINAGKLGDESTLAKATHELQHLLDDRGEEFQGGTHAFVLEGMARGWAGVDPSRGMDVIAKAWEVRDSCKDAETSSMLRFVQLVRSQAEIEISLQDGTNTDDMTKKLEQALAFSRAEGYDRYVQQLEALGNRIK